MRKRPPHAGYVLTPGQQELCRLVSKGHDAAKCFADAGFAQARMVGSQLAQNPEFRRQFKLAIARGEPARNAKMEAETAEHQRKLIARGMPPLGGWQSLVPKVNIIPQPAKDE